MIEELVGGIFGGVGWGLGGAAMAAAVLLGGPRAKPLMKNVIKGYLSATDRVRTAAAEATETFQDLYAEAKHEHDAQSHSEGAQPHSEGHGTTQSSKKGSSTIPIENADATA